ncbi:galactose-binding domain-containing protein [Actinopolymorpha pittospori]
MSTANLAGNAVGAGAPFGTPVPSASGQGDVWALVDGSVRPDGGWRSEPGADAWVAVDLMRPRAVNAVTLYAGATPPSRIRVQAWTGSDWLDVANATASPATPAQGRDLVTFDTVRTRRLRLLLTADGDAPVEIREVEVRNGNLLSDASGLGLTVTPSASYTYPGDTVLGPLDGSYADVPHWTSWDSKNAQDWYAVRLDRPVTASRLVLHFYDDHGGVQPPRDYTVEYWDGTGWRPVQETGRRPERPAAGFNAVDFTPVSAAGFRLLATNQNPVDFGVYVGVTDLERLGP